MFAPKMILVPTDFSPCSDQALRKAADIAAQFGSKIFLLHVIDERIRQCAIDYCLQEEVMSRLEQESIQTSKEKLQGEVDAISEARQLEIIFDIVVGVPAEMIIKEQQDRGIDLIVIASHGRTGLMKYVMGSVAEKVVGGAKCPVLVVK
ncbi:MAG: universal stress protein [Deltaproteobacteria bacterium]|nr:universal stress protein [Deltaproteobacteria bacterium]